MQVFVLFLCLLLVFFVPGAAAGEPPHLVGEAALVMDARSGQILYGKNINRKMYPASTTKILTAILALEKADVDEVVTISRRACTVEGSAVGLQEGEKIRMEDLLYALMLSSANDAAVAIAEHVGGSVEGFAEMMNEKARLLGARNSHFVNPHGLPDPAHYTTARDLALISRYAMNDPRFREIVSTVHREIGCEFTFRGEPQTWLWNHNKLLSRYEGATGIKTGYTVEAGQCLVASAKRGDRELIAVVLKSQGSNVYSDAAALLDYGFNSFTPNVLVEKGEVVGRVAVRYGVSDVTLVAARDFIYNFPVNASSPVERDVILREPVKAPVEQGDVIGELVFTQRESELGRVDLIAQEPVPRKLVARWWFWATQVLVLMFLLGVRAAALRRRRRRYYRRLARR